jgi:hypothetical protein
MANLTPSQLPAGVNAAGTEPGVFDQSGVTVGLTVSQILAAGQPGAGGATAASRRLTFPSVPIGSVAYASFGNSSTMVAGSIYYSSIWIPTNVTLTGIGVLIGTTGTTDNWTTALYNAAGTVLANSALAGATVSTASTIQKFAFSPGTISVVGPALYYIAVQSNGTHATLATVAASTFTDVQTGSTTGAFGTFTALTIAGTFTANVGPIGFAY